MLNVMTIVGTRPEIIKMSRVIAECDLSFNHTLVHTGQNYDYELNQVFFDELDIRKPDAFLNAAGATPAKTIAAVLEKTDDLFAHHKPDALLLYGDTNSCMAVISAKRHKIPVFHMEAGNRCFDQRVPEELNRKVVDHLSDVNMVLTDHARNYLLREGLKPELIFKTGSHMPEVLDYYLDSINRSEVLEKEGLKPNQYFLVSLHREENVDQSENLQTFLEALQKLTEKYSFPVLVSTHPRTRKRLEGFKIDLLGANISFHKPFGFLDYIKLQENAFCVLSDSGTITEETSLLNLPAITLRTAHERPEGMDHGTVIMSPIHIDRILESVEMVIRQRKDTIEKPVKVSQYGNQPVSRQIVRIVQSYVEYINRVIWSKP